jgi:hypothetical protein
MFSEAWLDLSSSDEETAPATIVPIIVAATIMPIVAAAKGMGIAVDPAEVAVIAVLPVVAVAAKVLPIIMAEATEAEAVVAAAAALAVVAAAAALAVVAAAAALEAAKTTHAHTPRDLRASEQTIASLNEPAYWELCCPWLTCRRDSKRESDAGAPQGARLWPRIGAPPTKRRRRPRSAQEGSRRRT